MEYECRTEKIGGIVRGDQVRKGGIRKRSRRDKAGKEGGSIEGQLEVSLLWRPAKEYEPCNNEISVVLIVERPWEQAVRRRCR